MTEAEWLDCTDPWTMLDQLGDGLSDRKFRLYGCGCCRLIWHRLSDERLRRAVEVSEQIADGALWDAEVEAVRVAADEATEGTGHVITRLAADAACSAFAFPGDAWQLHCVYENTARVLEGERLEAEGLGPEAINHWNEVCSESGRPQGWTDLDTMGVVSERLREVIGNPFRAVAIDPAWLTPAVTALARTIYDEHSYDRMPELADAFERAGCTDADILDHCRGPGPHVRGCWVVDLVLGRS